MTQRNNQKFTRDQFVIFKLKRLSKYLNRLKNLY